MKKIPFIILTAAALLLMNSCFLFGPMTRTVSGTIYGDTTNLKIGAFDDVFNFQGGSSLGTEHEVYSELSSNTVFTPIATATITGNTYTIELPENVSDMGDLIAWVDSGLYSDQFQMNDSSTPPTGERGYLPVKTINGLKYVVEITTIGNSYGFEFDNTEEYLDAYNSGGFNFYIDVNPADY